MLVKIFKSQLKYHILALLIMLTVVFGGVFLLKSQIILAQEGSSEPSANEDLISDLNKQIDDQRAKIDELSEKMDEYKENIKYLREDTVSLQNQIYILNNQIAKTNLDLEAKQEEIEITELEIERVELEVEDNEVLINQDKERLAAFIRQLDIYDRKNYLSVLLSNNSFSEFFDQIKHLEGMSEDLQKTLNRVQELVEKLNLQKDELNDKRDRLSELLNKLEEEKLTLENQNATKNYLITETRNSERKYQDLLSSVKQERLQVDALVTSLEKKLRQQLESRGEAEKFNSFGNAQLGWPSTVRWITAYFHDPDYPYRHLFEHSGIDLGTPMGTPIKSAEAGYVARVSYGKEWYGNYIMIIHNNNLATLYAHLSDINVKTDQYVGKGQIIGHSGSTGFSSGPHLHFEVRYNGIPVNPLNYLP